MFSEDTGECDHKHDIHIYFVLLTHNIVHVCIENRLSKVRQLLSCESQLAVDIESF